MTLRWTDFATGDEREMTQSALDAAMSPSSCIPSIDDELKKYAALSKAAREASRAADRLHEGLAYGDDSDARLDLLRPVAAQAAPVLVYIHGGYWQQLGRGDSAFGARAINASGRRVGPRLATRWHRMRRSARSWDRCALR